MHDTLRHHKVTLISGGTLVAKRIRPNDRCLCGSGKKAKYCCGAQTKYYRTDREKR